MPSLAGNGVMYKCDRCYDRVADGELPASFAGPAELSETLEHLARCPDPFVAEDLPGDLTEESKRLVAQKLLAMGVVRRAAKPDD